MSNLAQYRQRDFTSQMIDFQRHYVSTSTFDQVPVEILPPGKLHVEAALNYLATLEDDWNGEGAIAPSGQAIEAAHAFNEHYFIDRKYPDKVSPDGDGAVLFIWQTLQSRLTLTIEAALIHISIAHQNGKVDLPDSVPYDLTAIPNEILQYIPKVDRTNGKKNT